MMGTTTDQVEMVMRQNWIDAPPGEFAVISADKNTIRLLCYLTRDVIIIQRGDRNWPEK